MQLDKVKHKRIVWKVHCQSHLLPRKFFLVGLDNVVGIRDKRQVITRK